MQDGKGTDCPTICIDDCAACKDIKPSAASAGSIAEMVARADADQGVKNACDTFGAEYEKWINGKGNYPSTSGIVGALMAAGIFKQ